MKKTALWCWMMRTINVIKSTIYFLVFRVLLGIVLCVIDSYFKTNCSMKFTLKRLVFLYYLLLIEHFYYKLNFLFILSLPIFSYLPRASHTSSNHLCIACTCSLTSSNCPALLCKASCCTPRWAHSNCRRFKLFSEFSIAISCDAKLRAECIKIYKLVAFYLPLLKGLLG